MSLPQPAAEAFVLAGGRSSRMGQDKSFVEIAGRPLIEHSIQILLKAGLNVRIAGARSQLTQFAPVVPDLPENSGLGPLAGICAALVECPSRAVFLPVDLPLIPPSLIRYLVHHATVTDAAATVVSVAGFVQTFPAVIDRAALESLRNGLHSDDRKCLKAFRAVPGGLTVLPLELLAQAGQVRHPHALHPAQWFMNINTPKDVAQATAAMAAAVSFPSPNSHPPCRSDSLQ